MLVELTCTCRRLTIEASALEKADILVVVIQPLLEGADRWCLYNVLWQGIPTVDDSLGEEELPGIKSAVSHV